MSLLSMLSVAYDLLMQLLSAAVMVLLATSSLQYTLNRILHAIFVLGGLLTLSFYVLCITFPQFKV